MRAHEILPKITIAKIEKTGQIVQLVKHADHVGFSDEQGWFLINTNPGADTGPSDTVKWIPDTTRFTWVKKLSNIDEATDAEDVLDYVKRKHGSDFDIDHAIIDHPIWHLTLVPIRKLKLDPEGKHQDPYGRVNSVNSNTVTDILPNIQNIVRSSPIVVDSNGWIIDGNHRATAAHLAGLKQIPAYIPIN